MSRSKTRRWATDWLLPPLLKVAMKRAMSRMFKTTSAEERTILASNARLQGAFVGRRCFVIANGPSLRTVDIGSLGNEVTVVMNHFNRHPAIERWQPVVHCAAEPASFYDGPGDVGYLRDLLTGYRSTIHVFPIEMRPVFERTQLVPRDRLILVKQDGRPASEFRRIDLTEPMPSAHDTSVLAVSVAIAMGCSPIVLLGLDYNWLSHRSVNTHFYDDATMIWPVEDMARTSYVAVMRQSIPSWEAHAALREIAARSGQVVLNATEGSFLDAYQFTTLADVFARDGDANPIAGGPRTT